MGMSEDYERWQAGCVKDALKLRRLVMIGAQRFLKEMPA